jgi:hypothetical protein
MVFRVLADAVVVLHLAFILFAVLGGLLVLRWPRVIWAHLPAAAWGAAVEFCGWICPLTPLENQMRRAGGAAAYSGGFVERYVVPIVYPAELSREFQVFLGCAVVGINAAIYLYVWRGAASRRSRP